MTQLVRSRAKDTVQTAHCALGMILSTKLRAIYPRADPIICGMGILISAVFLTSGILLCDSNVVLALVLIFFGEVSLNLNWSIVADMVLYVVNPTCRGTAEALQILLSHALGIRLLP